MEKTLTIDGKEVVFKSNAAFAIIYKEQFGEDILSKFMPVISELLQGMDDLIENPDDIKPSDIGDMLEHLYSFELTDLMNLIWCLAKLGDKEISEPKKWYLSFKEFPIVDVAMELGDILLSSLVSKKKLKELKKLTLNQ